MRKVLIAIGLLACAAALSGCDVWDRLTAPPKPQVVTCNCAPPLRGARNVQAQRAERFTPPPRRYSAHRHSARHHHYRHYAYSGSYRWKKRYAERSVDIYNHSSSSQSYGAQGYAYGEGDGYGYGHGACCEHGWHRVTAEGSSHVWADGYGRRHRYSESAEAHYSYDARQRALQTPQRLDPWHGYNDDWD